MTEILGREERTLSKREGLLAEKASSYYGDGDGDGR